MLNAQLTEWAWGTIPNGLNAEQWVTLLSKYFIQCDIHSLL